jgi:hypothetical protein
VDEEEPGLDVDETDVCLILALDDDADDVVADGGGSKGRIVGLSKATKRSPCSSWDCEWRRDSGICVCLNKEW